MSKESPKQFDITNKRIWVAGHNGMVGSALLRRLQNETCDILTTTRAELNLTDQRAVHEWVAVNKPDAIIIAAAKVGGIWANMTYPADFIYDNLMIEANIIHAAFRAKIGKLALLGSSCIYPKQCPQPMREEHLLTGALEPTNEWYAIAKIAGIKLCQAYREQHGSDFISVMPCNLYGPNDNFDLKTSHVLPALVAKVHQAKLDDTDHVEVWGSGKPRREFMHVDDLADGVVFALQHYSDQLPLNIGSGTDISINDLVKIIFKTIGYRGNIKQSIDKPDGTFVKLMDSSRITKLGWRPSISLAQGLVSTYQWYLEHHAVITA